MAVKKASKYFLPLLVVLSLGFQAVTSFAVTFPEPSGYVNDFAGMLSETSHESLEKQLSDYEKPSTNEIAVVTVKSLEGLTISDFAVRLFENWKIGKKNADNGVLLLIAKKERKIRIEVGYGLEPELTDLEASQIIENIISPAFKQGSYEKGIVEAVSAIKKSISTDDEKVDLGTDTTEEPISDRLETLLFFAVAFAVAGSSFFARTKSWWAGGIAGTTFGGILGFFMFGLLGLILSALGFGLLGLILDYFLSKPRKKGKDDDDEDSSRRGWWPWFGGGGSDSDSGSGDAGGGDFGGFGGGESGGGGADGGW